MRVATIRNDNGTAAVWIKDDEAFLLPFGDVREMLSSGSDWAIRVPELADGRLALDNLSLAPLIPTPDKIVCVGVNYRAHAAEAGLGVSQHPVLFSKFTGSLLGAHDDIQLPPNSTQVDWEAELCVVIGRTLRYGDTAAAATAIAGYTVANDISMRDWQMRTSQFLQGKTFQATTPVGPHLVTLDELSDADDLSLTCEVDGEQVQSTRTSDMIFSPRQIVAYVSQIITLQPGDLILMGTPSGVGLGMSPPRYLQPGSVVRTTLDGVGELVNYCAVETAQSQAVRA